MVLRIKLFQHIKDLSKTREDPSPAFVLPSYFKSLTPHILTDLEWKIIYVGSAESEEFDQILDSVLVGPVPAGRHMFIFQVRKTRPEALAPRIILFCPKAHGVVQWFRFRILALAFKNSDLSEVLHTFPFPPPLCHRCHHKPLITVDSPYSRELCFRRSL